MGLNDIFSKLLDPYERQARLYPGLLVVAPGSVVYVCLVGTGNLLGSTLLSVLASCGVAYALGRIARDAGRRLQDGLFDKWGGAPTTIVLRHSDTTIDAHTKARYHRVLAAAIGNLPTPAIEAADPKKADEYYRGATIWLLGQTRDTNKFPLVFKENIAFGFQRNALGLRRGGIVVSVLCILVVLTRMVLTTHFFASPSLEALGQIKPSYLVAFVVSLAFLALWIFWISEDAMKRTAFAYAVRLLESCDHLAAVKVPAAPMITDN